MIHEVQLDGLIGPTHFFGGLASGNLASAEHAGQVSFPRAAALQGLAKMKMVHDLGIMQLVMPPHPRPALPFLRDIGFSGAAEQVMRDVSETAPGLLPVVYSSSAMWAANAATTCASEDAADGRVHITPANLLTNAHRALEAPFTSVLLKRIFFSDAFIHHPPLLGNVLLADEGAANHMRVTTPDGKALHIFVHGADGANTRTKTYQARQQKQASLSVARLHGLDPEYTMFLQQNPEAIDAGAFHNDVIATSNDQWVIYHEQAYADDAPLVDAAKRYGIHLCKISVAELSLQEAVKSYLFNSQILTLEKGAMHLLAPLECKRSTQARQVIERWIADSKNPIAAVHYVDLTQSMQNGGGPACLRFRLWLQEKEKKGIHQSVVFSPELFEVLGNWVTECYPEQLTRHDLADPALPVRVHTALRELERHIEMKGLYDGYY